MNRTERSARVKRTSTEYFFFPYHTIPLTVCSAGAASPPRQSSSARTASEPAVSSARIAAPAAHAAASVRTLRKWHREAGSRPPAQHAALHPPVDQQPAHPHRHRRDAPDRCFSTSHRADGRGASDDWRRAISTRTLHGDAGDRGPVECVFGPMPAVSRRNAI